jgi:hypothetical protein
MRKTGRERIMQERFYYAARNKGVIKAFTTEGKAYAFAEDHRSIALYSTTDGKSLTFVRAIEPKTSAEVLAAMETVAKAA